MNEQHDHQLIQRLLAGEESAFREAVQSYQSTMLYVARSLVGTAIAEEVVQEAWVSIIKALPNFEGRSSLKTWIIRIVSNNAKSRLRKESRMTSVGDANDIETLSIPNERFRENGHWAAPPNPWQVSSPDEIVESEQLKSVIYQCLGQLPPLQQSLIVLREMEGLPMEEICKILDISESNSRVLLHRARTRMWQAIEEYQEH